MQSAVAIDKLHMERTWTDHRMAHSINWNLYRSTHLHYLKENKELLVWELTSGEPKVLHVLKVISVGLTFASGLFATLQDGQGRNYTVGATPREIISGVFLWAPAFSELRYTPTKYAEPGLERHLTFPMCSKTLSRADAPVEGHRYVSTIREFCRAWPNAKS
jgi:hypothetical protein